MSEVFSIAQGWSEPYVFTDKMVAKFDKDVLRRLHDEGILQTIDGKVHVVKRFDLVTTVYARK